MEGISFVHFDDKDVVRHSLVQRIIKAYERYQDMTLGRQLALKNWSWSPPEPVEATEPAETLTESEVPLA